MSLFDTRPQHRNAYGQLVDPPPVAPLNPTVAEADAPRLSRQHHAILAALRTGPKSNVELSQIGLRFGARLAELREAGFTITKAQGEAGVWTYTLTEEGVGEVNASVSETSEGGSPLSQPIPHTPHNPDRQPGAMPRLHTPQEFDPD